MYGQETFSRSSTFGKGHKFVKYKDYISHPFHFETVFKHGNSWCHLYLLWYTCSMQLNNYFILVLTFCIESIFLNSSGLPVSWVKIITSYSFSDGKVNPKNDLLKLLNCNILNELQNLIQRGGELSVLWIDPPIVNKWI